MIEEWRPVVGFEGWYEVSDFGRVRRVMPDPRRPAHIMPRLLRPVASKGYRNVTLYVLGVPHIFGVHVLVAAAFIGPCPDGHEVNHKFGIRSDNRPDQLEYMTRSQNVEHSFRVLVGRDRRYGMKNHNVRATTEEVAEARRLLDGGALKKDIAAYYGHDLSWAYRIANRETRNHG